MATRFGTQPAKQIMYAQRWPINRAAAEIDVEYHHLVRALNGVTSPRPEIRERLPVLLDVPLEDLFTPAAIARPFACTAPARDWVGAR